MTVFTRWVGSFAIPVMFADLAACRKPSGAFQPVQKIVVPEADVSAGRGRIRLHREESPQPVDAPVYAVPVFGRCPGQQPSILSPVTFASGSWSMSLQITSDEMPAQVMLPVGSIVL